MTMHNTSSIQKQRSTSWLGSGYAERSVFKLLDQLDFGSLDLQMPDGAMRHFGAPTGQLQADGPAPPRVAMSLHDKAVFQRVLSSGDIGLAESYMDGQWDSPHLTELLVLMMRNREVLERVVYGSAIGSIVHRLRHRLRRNSRAGSRRNIQAHYDLGNRFYQLWLDPTMNYSSAWFAGNPGEPMPQAQDRKIDRALDETGVKPNSHVLEIGCGWGALVERAVQRGARVTGVTLSHEQLAWAVERVNRVQPSNDTPAPLGKPPIGSAELLLKDYRDLGREPDFGGYDAIVSIEMFEAVGREYWDSYFDTLRRCLKPQGRACIQSIVIRDDLFDRYVKSSDFIQQYVFPGGLLPSAQAFRDQAAKAGLVVEHDLSFGQDYAETLRRWRESFLAALPQVKAQGFDQRFIKLWDFYLAYCEAAFLTGNTNVMQFTLRRA